MKIVKVEKEKVEINSNFFLNDIFGKMFCSYHGFFNMERIDEQIVEEFEYTLEEKEIDIKEFEKFLIDELDKMIKNKVDEKQTKEYLFLSNFLWKDGGFCYNTITNYETNFVTKAMEDVINEIDFGIFGLMELVNVIKPREYNFVSDSFDFNISTNKSITDIQTEFIKVFTENKDNTVFLQLLKDKFESRSGFISFVSELSNIQSIFEILNDIEELENNLEHLIPIYICLVNQDLFFDFENENIYDIVNDVFYSTDFFNQDYSIVYNYIEKFNENNQ